MGGGAGGMCEVGCVRVGGAGGDVGGGAGGDVGGRCCGMWVGGTGGDV